MIVNTAISFFAAPALTTTDFPVFSQADVAGALDVVQTVGDASLEAFALFQNQPGRENLGDDRLAEQVTSAMLAALRSKSPQSFVELGGGGAAGGGLRTASSKSSGTVRPAEVKRPSLSPEEHWMGIDVWHLAFDYVLKQLLPNGNRQWAGADPHLNVPVRIVALRMLGVGKYGLNTVEKFLDALEAVTGIVLDENEDTRLRQMAHSVLTDWDLHGDVLNNFLIPAVMILESGLPETDQRVNPRLPNNEEVERKAMEAHRERILLLNERLKEIPQRRPPYQGVVWEPYSPGVDQKIVAPLFQYPPWPDVLPQLLNLKGDEAAMAAQAREIFEVGMGTPWRRIVALAYYSYLVHRKKGFALSRQEADRAFLVLWGIVAADNNKDDGSSNHLLKMALHAALGVVTRRFHVGEEESAGNDQARLEELRWAEERLGVLQTTFKKVHRGRDLSYGEKWVLDGVEHWRRQMQEAIARLDPPWPARLGRWLGASLKISKPS